MELIERLENQEPNLQEEALAAANSAKEAGDFDTALAIMSALVQYKPKKVKTPKVDWQAKMEEQVPQGDTDTSPALFIEAMQEVGLPEGAHIVQEISPNKVEYKVKGVRGGGERGPRQNNVPVGERTPYATGAFPGSRPLYPADKTVNGTTVKEEIEAYKNANPQPLEDKHLQRYLYDRPQYGIGYRALQKVGAVPAIEGDDWSA